MTDSVTFKGINRRKIVHFLNLCARYYSNYNANKIRNWQINRQLENLKKLSESSQNKRELLDTLHYLEKRIKSSYPDDPIDGELLKKIYTVIHDINEKISPSRMETNSTKSLNSLILESQRKKIAMIQRRYEELKRNPYANVTQLQGIRMTLERLKQQIKDPSA